MNERRMGALGEKLLEAMARAGAGKAEVAPPEREAAPDPAPERSASAVSPPLELVQAAPAAPTAPPERKKPCERERRKKRGKQRVPRAKAKSKASVGTARMILGAPRLSAEAAAALQAQEAARRAPPAPAPAVPLGAPVDLRAQMKARMTGLADAFERRECALAKTVEVTPAERETLRRRIAAGVGMAPGREGGEVVDLVLGVDFGSTTTKLVVRAPYLPDAPAFAIPVPDFAQADDHPHLWASRLWEGADGALSLTPLPGAAAICAIKTRLMQGGDAASQAEAAAYLAQVLAHARGWVMTGRPDITRRGSLLWSYNFGFPAQSLDASVLAERYRRVVAAALALSDGAQQPTRESAVAALRHVEGDAGARLDAAAATLQPEVAAAMAGVAKFGRLDDGLFALVDVGGGTTDIGAFNLFQTRDGARRMPIFNASVEMSGAEPARLCDDDPVLREAFKEALMVQARAVIWGARARYPLSPRWTDQLPVYFIGGGIAHPQHQRLAKRVSPWLCATLPGSRGARIVQRPDFGGVEHGAGPDRAHRLCVAAGLSLTVDEIPEVIPPHAIDAPPQGHWAAPDMIGPEQV